MNDTLDPTVYTDPYPGLKGTDTVTFKCGMCDNGLYTGPSGLTFVGVTADSRRVDKWCFHCNGAGQYVRTVKNLRAAARRDAKLAAQEAAERPYREWLAADRNWHKFLADEEAAYAEQARRAALVTGFVGEPGDKLHDLDGTVTVSYSFERYNSFKYADELVNMLVITLTDGKVVTWTSGSVKAFGWEIGEPVRIVTATVKKHGNYKGQDQTQLTNVRLGSLN